MSLLKNTPFDIGFLAGNDLNETIKMAKKAEGYGFSACWIAEDYFYGGAFSTATTCAVNTEKIQIGIGVINPYTRHPALTAMETAALDAAAQGRTILGMGASNKLWMQQQMGIPFEKPLASMKESIEIIRELLAGREVEKDGEYFKTGKMKLHFKPFRSQVPIYMGVKGPKALEIAGGIADGVLMSIMTSEPYVKYAKKILSESAVAAKRDAKDVKAAAYLVIYISEDRDEARTMVKPMIAKYLGLHGTHPILTTTGMAREDIDKFREAFLKKEDATHLVTDWMVDTFAVAGNPEECRSKLTALIEAGIDRPVAFEIPGVPIEKTMHQIKRYFFD